jgi:hypothetical protein
MLPISYFTEASRVGTELIRATRQTDGHVANRRYAPSDAHDVLFPYLYYLYLLPSTTQSVCYCLIWRWPKLRDRWKKGVIKPSGRKVRPSTNYAVVVSSYDDVHSLGIAFNWYCTGETTDLRPWYTAFMYISSHELDNKTAHEPAVHKCRATVNSGLISLLSCQPAVLLIIRFAWKDHRKQLKPERPTVQYTKISPNIVDALMLLWLRASILLTRLPFGKFTNHRSLKVSYRRTRNTG